jgi:hypothetical protein
MTLQTFLESGYLLVFVQYQTTALLLAVTVNNAALGLSEGTFTVRPISAEQEGSADSNDELPLVTVGATYVSPLITTANGDVFDAALYEMA